MEQALIEIAKQLPSAGLLIIAVRWLLKKLEAKELQVEFLQKELLMQEKENSKTSRESEKLAIQTLLKATDAMEAINDTLSDGK